MKTKEFIKKYKPHLSKAQIQTLNYLSKINGFVLNHFQTSCIEFKPGISYRATFVGDPEGGFLKYEIEF